MNKSFLRKVIIMLSCIRIGNMVLFIDRSGFKFKKYGIGAYKKALVVNIWEFSIYLVTNRNYWYK